MSKTLLTASSMGTFLGCPRKYFFSYEVGLRSAKPSEALFFGTAFHLFPELKSNGVTDFGEALGIALSQSKGDWKEETVAKLTGLGRGYWDFYSEDDCIEAMEAEKEFRVPIPGSRAFESAGKIDGIARLKDGRIALVEHKTTSDSIVADSSYWVRLRFNRQLLKYVDACRKSGIKLDTILYDVIRKPSIRVKQNETCEAYAERLYQDTQTRPEFYFARREVTITDTDIERFNIDQRAVCKMILGCRSEARRCKHPEDGFPKTNTQMTCLGCPYEQICLSGEYLDLQNIPCGMVVENNVHSELTM